MDGYSESTAGEPKSQEILFRDRNGRVRLLVLTGIPAIDDLVAIVRDARYRSAEDPPPRLQT